MYRHSIEAEHILNKLIVGRLGERAGIYDATILKYKMQMPHVMTITMGLNLRALVGEELKTSPNCYENVD